MTDEEYLRRSGGAQERLRQGREQINAHVGKSERRLASPLIRPLLDRQQEIIDELADLDQGYWNA